MNVKTKGDSLKKWEIFKWLSVLSLALILSACVAARDAKWKTVPEVNMPYDKAWGIVVNAITQHFDLEISDAQSGYLRSEWKITERVWGRDILKARVSVRIENKKPFRVKVKVEKQEIDFFDVWITTGNDETMENEILEELSGRLR
jgi:hypothetical protein